MNLHDNPRRCSYAHNFTVHYRQSVLQTLADEPEVSIPSADPQMQKHTTRLVLEEFNQKVQLDSARQGSRRSLVPMTYNVSKMEYEGFNREL